jgi:riboflavin kinase/FMN adenylyltransferase
MNLFRSFAEAAGGDIRSLALGFFDGVHRGHQRVIAGALDGFAASGGVLTFEPHPRAVLTPGAAPLLLTGLPHKLRNFAALGVKNILLLPFDEAMALTTAGQFLQALGKSFPGLRRVSVGANWRFGRGREGGAEMLRRWCGERGVTLVVTESASYRGEVISSSRIRELVANGGLARAGEMLGGPYALFGTVAHGRRLGRQLGFPTANLDTLDQCLPPHGVYFGRVAIDGGGTLPAAINIGVKPSLGDSGRKVSVEAHLPGFQGDLYGAAISVVPEQFWRAEQKFPSLAALKSQLAADLAAAEDYFRGARHA